MIYLPQIQTRSTQPQMISYLCQSSVDMKPLCSAWWWQSKIQMDSANRMATFIWDRRDFNTDRLSVGRRGRGRNWIMRVNLFMLTTMVPVIRMPHSPNPWWNKWNRCKWTMAHTHKRLSILLSRKKMFQRTFRPADWFHWKWLSMLNISTLESVFCKRYTKVRWKLDKFDC